MIDTGSDQYISEYCIYKNADIRSKDWLNPMLKNDIFRNVTYQLKEDTIDNSSKFSIDKSTDFVFCTCDLKEKKDAQFTDFKCNKYNPDVTKDLLNQRFNYDSNNFYYFFILKKEDYQSLFNIKFSKVEIFNTNITYSKATNRDKIVFESKTKRCLGNCNNKCSLEESIIECVKNNFIDFYQQNDDLRCELFFAEKIELKEIFSTPFENITQILTKLGSKNEENILSLDLKYKDEADIKLLFEIPSGYNLNIDKKECTIHFDIKNKFAEKNQPENSLKRSITDVININTVREELEKKEFKIGDKKVKLPTSCFNVAPDKEKFDQFIVKIKIPEEDSEKANKTLLLEKFLTKIPPKIEEKVEKNCCGCKKNKKNKKSK